MICWRWWAAWTRRCNCARWWGAGTASRKSPPTWSRWRSSPPSTPTRQTYSWAMSSPRRRCGSARSPPCATVSRSGSRFTGGWRYPANTVSSFQRTLQLRISWSSDLYIAFLNKIPLILTVLCMCIFRTFGFIAVVSASQTTNLSLTTYVIYFHSQSEFTEISPSY